MQILVDGSKVYTANSSSISQRIDMSVGSHQITVQAKGTSGPWVSAGVKVIVGGNTSPITVSVSPKVVSLVPGGTQQFSSSVTGTTQTGVSWSVNGVGTISASGFYTAPFLAGNAIVTALSVADSSKSDNASVSVSGNPFAMLVGCNAPGMSSCVFNASPTVPQPAVGTNYIDPDYGTVVRRITPAVGEGSVGAYLQNNYSPQQPWNADGTKLLLLAGDGFYHLLDGTGYGWIRKLGSTQVFYSGLDLTPKWDSNDPDKFWYASVNKIYSYSVSADASTLVKTFSLTDVPAGDSAWTKDYSNISADSCVWALSVTNSNYQTVRLLAYNRCTDTVLASRSVGDVGSGADFQFAGCPCNKIPADISVSPSGQFIIMETNTSAANNPLHYSVEIYDTTLNFQRRLPNGTNGTGIAAQVIHSDSGYDADGNDIYVSQLENSLSADYRAITAYRLSDGTETRCQLPDTFYSTSPINNWHVSMRHTLRPGTQRGWVLISTYTEPANGTSGQTNVDPDVPGDSTLLNEEIFFCHLDGGNEVRRVAHNQTIRSDYFAEPHASSSWDGKKVIFNSTWRNNYGSLLISTDVVNAYVASGW
jgi:hypothetical protein